MDVEPLRDLHPDLMTIAFDEQEHALLSALPPVARREWSLRLWCAKEAMGKALALGLPSGPRGLVIRDLDPGNGSVRAALTPRLAAWAALPRDTVLEADTGAGSGLVLAICVARRASLPGAGHPENGSQA